MAKDELTGNMPTENLISYFDASGVATGLDMEAFKEAVHLAADVFPG